MFKPKEPAPPVPAEEKNDAAAPEEVKLEEKKDASPEALRELVEKNLKWSQIIYEQNRRINAKLLWLAIARWLKMAFYVVLIGLAVWFIPPLIQNLNQKYSELVGGAKPGEISPAFSSKVCEFLSLDSAKCEQLKTLVK